MEENNETLTDFMLNAKKKAEDRNPILKKLSEIEPIINEEPIYGYIITFSSN
jgi:hypothetical protein